MADQNMRLRLVVRRNDLPEIRLMWNVRLSGDPTIAQLLEQLNEDVPLESDAWGLEDYVVELHDTDGTDFECLHYQSVRSLLKPDDRVYIRALQQDDRRRRRVSGRVQISSNGRHLIDGVPFGRPRLIAANNRPAVDIPPPRKRARISYAQQSRNMSDDDEAGRESPMLLLTSGEPRMDGQPSSNARALLDPEDSDSESDDADYTEGDDAGDASAQSSLEDDDEEEGEQEAVEGAEEQDEGSEDAALLDHNTTQQGEAMDTEEESEESEENEENEEGEEGEGEGEEADDHEDEDEQLLSKGSDEENLDQEIHNTTADNTTLHNDVSPETATTGHRHMDKSSLLHTAFPTAPAATCGNILVAANDDLKTAYNVLAECFAPQMSRDAVLASHTATSNRGLDHGPALVLGGFDTDRGALPVSPKKPMSAEMTLPVGDVEEDQEEDQEDEDQEDIPNFLRKYDHAGFPPGTITSGNGLARMAEISGSFASSSKLSNATQATSTTLKVSNESSAVEDDDNSGGSSDSSSATSSDASSDTSSDSDDEDALASGESSSSDSDGSDSESDDDSDEESETSVAHDRSISSDSDDDSDSDDNSDDNDEGPEVRPLKDVGEHNAIGSNKQAGELNTASHDDSDARKRSEKTSSSVYNKAGAALPANAALPKRLESQAGSTPPEVKSSRAADVPVRPGAGKESTKRRNARRRAAKIARREGEGRVPDSTTNVPIESIPTTNAESAIDQTRALFEAKRQALLDAIAAGGIEIGPSGETALERDSPAANHAKRKRSEEANATAEPRDENGNIEAGSELAPDHNTSTPGSEKRRRIDLGAGRRLVFGALGLRNPKDKADEDKLREKLQSAVSQTGSLSGKPRSEVASEREVGAANEDEDPDAWKLKINYRAVECCYDDIELSPAPFPFQQRWDPQQRSSKRNKRGGQSKRTQRNQPEFYQDGGAGKKRKRRNSVEHAISGYGDSGYEVEIDAEVTLNYDDTAMPEQEHDAYDDGPEDETSQVTDVDDLPCPPTSVSILPTLHPNRARAGMVISWAKWSCSSATRWQPQLSRVTAIITRVNEDAASLEVCLAKRDRHLDGNEKRYDETGQRIYDKFEAPDIHEEDEDDDTGVDEGHRTVYWTEMLEPKVLVSEEIDDAEMDNQMSPTDTTMEDMSKAAITNVGSPWLGSVPNPDTLRDVRMGVSSGERSVKTASNSTSFQANPGQQAADISMSDLSQASSPSRQLRETAGQAVGPRAQSDPFIQVERTEVSSPVSISLPALAAGSSLPFLQDLENGDAVAGTPKALQPTNLIPPSTSSVLGGRQPDFTLNEDEEEDDDGGYVPDSFGPMHDDTDYQDHFGPSSPGDAGDAETTAGLEDFKKSPVAPADPRSSPSSLDSLWCTALTSRSAPTPSKAQPSSSAQRPDPVLSPHAINTHEVIPSFDENEDLVEEDNGPTMQTSASLSIDTPRLKEERDSGWSSQPVMPTLRRSPRQIRTKRRNVVGSISPPPPRRVSKPFTIPPGSQVLELSSDSDSDADLLMEKYADDDADGNYSPDQDQDSSLPKGEGWVQKKRGRGRPRRRT
ncbi:hypothetical protein GGS20DRAFT_567482 [Poronia punctata]|nr:hypothetical protein GGS20DRAFT_567482 [Poronia punctata]